MSFHLVELIGNEVVDLHAQVGSQLTHVLFGHYHLLVSLQHLGGVLWQWVKVLEVGLCHFVAFGAQFVHGRVQVTVGRAEAHDEQVGIGHVAFYLKVGYFNVSYLLLAQTGH